MEGNKYPTISVIIPTHNRADLLSRSILSVLGQTYKPLEIIIINDGSADNTEEIVRGLQKNIRNIIYLKHEHPKGAPAARNLGIKNASGELVTFFDDDDEMLPQKIELQRKLYDDKYAYVGSGNKSILKNKKIKIKIPDRIITYNDILYQNTTGIPILVKKERLEAIGGFDERLLSLQDTDLLVRLNEKYGHAICVQKPLFIVHTEIESPRITISKNKFIGAFSFYKKHKNKMNRSQKKYQLFYLIKLRKKKISLKKFFWLVPKRFYWPEIKYYLLMKFSDPDKQKT